MMSNDRWHIEGSFRDGSHRVRNEKGQYKSLSQAILEETSEIESFDEDELAELFEVDTNIIIEHLGHLRQKGLIEGGTGNWYKPRDFDIYDNPRKHRTPEQKWANEDDESLY